MLRRLPGAARRWAWPRYIIATAYVDNTVVSQSVYLTVNVLAPSAVAKH